MAVRSRVGQCSQHKVFQAGMPMPKDTPTKNRMKAKVKKESA